MDIDIHGSEIMYLLQDFSSSATMDMPGYINILNSERYMTAIMTIITM